ncbi:hypothetical protein [Limnobacter sp. CACIAM 66H1]|uniref:hypothetical protein n=1 Tax=Limnobacter sp. CACIAM 66H1 TaxID=1813033 RepID=UPI0025BBF59A|nr:hypothetical protein [Limnobacter sp. CACIAM 66H1]
MNIALSETFEQFPSRLLGGANPVFDWLYAFESDLNCFLAVGSFDREKIFVD